MTFFPDYKVSSTGFMRLAFVLTLLLGLVAVPVFAGGAQESETEVQLQKPPAYISPGNPATGHDQLTIDNIKLKIDPNAAIKSYIINIYNKNGSVIFSKSDSNLQGRGFLADAFNIGEIPQVKVPSTIQWPGTGTDGKVVPDGEYFYQLTVVDSYGKKTSSPPLSVVVDTKPPTIDNVNSNYRVFSPNGDGIKDTITFTHRTDAAYQWTESVLDSTGAVVWKKIQTAPGDTASSDIILSSDTVWDGKTSEAVGATPAGSVVVEGNYTYRLLGVDRAGNRVTKDLPITVSFAASDLGLTIRGGNTYFSSNQGILFVPTVKTPKGIQSWTLEITNSDGIVVRRLAGIGAPPETISWPGTGMPGRPESEGAILKDGVYTATLSTTYDSGTISESDPLSINADSHTPYAQIILDTLPTASEKNQALIFGSAGKELLSVVLRYEPDYDWTAHLQRLDSFQTASRQGHASYDLPLKSLLGAMKLVSTSPASENQTIANYSWDGTLPAESDGKQADKIDNGTWQITVSTTDKAGNLGQSPPARFIKGEATPVSDTTTTTVPLVSDASKPTITATPGLFSPDGDGDRDTTILTIDPKIPAESVAGWKVEILDPMQHSFRNWSGTGAPPATLVWDGKSDSGELVQSAMDYNAVLTIDDTAKNTQHALVTISIDILVFKDGNRIRIALPNIQFAGNSADLFESGQQVLDKNLDTLRRLARILNRFQDYHISVEGNATYVTKTPAEREMEQKNELLPLSRNRATEVKQALIILNVAADRMDTVGFGGSKPVVSHDDVENRWKNRRVEFILEKK